MDSRVEKVIDLLKADLCRDIPLDELARFVNLSASRLSHLFTAEVGQAPARYLKVLRLQRARDMLETTFLNIKEIANRVGLVNESHFVRDFAKVYGLTPARYRSRYLEAKTEVDKPLARAAARLANR